MFELDRPLACPQLDRKTVDVSYTLHFAPSCVPMSSIADSPLCSNGPSFFWGRHAAHELEPQLQADYIAHKIYRTCE